MLPTLHVIIIRKEMKGERKEVNMNKIIYMDKM
jgi:hypothetical protein